jgi:hypothetical protein
MLAREKSPKEEGSQKSGREREKKRQVWPEKGKSRARDMRLIESVSQGGEKYWPAAGMLRKSILLSGAYHYPQLRNVA